MNSVRPLALAATLLFSSAALATPATSTDTLDMTTRVSNVRMSVLDLTPDDGNAATYRYDVNQYSNRDVSINYGYGNKSFYDSNRPGTLDVWRGDTFATTNWSGVRGESDSAVHLAAGFDGYSRASTQQIGTITLAPYSKFFVTVDFEQVAVHSGSAGFRAMSDVSLSAFSPGRFVRKASDLTGESQEFDQAGSLTLEYANTTASSLVFQLDMFTSTWGVVGPTYFPVANVSAVPEPSTWLMLGAGMLGVAAVARRRQRG